MDGRTPQTQAGVFLLQTSLSSVITPLALQVSELLDFDLTHLQTSDLRHILQMHTRWPIVAAKANQ